MTTATEVLGPALEEGRLMSKPGYGGLSKVGYYNPQALHAIDLYQRKPGLVFPFFASGSSAYELNLGLISGHSSDVGLNVASWKSLIYAPNRISGPVQFVLKLLESWRLSKDDAVLLLGFDQKDNGFVQAVLAGTADLHGRDVRDRIAHLFHIRQTLSSLFRNLDVENEWLREPHTLLDEQEPLTLLLGGSMEDLLLVKEYVDAAAGR
jgi:hypothetical protein